MTKPHRSILIGLTVVLVAVAASTAVAVLNVSAQTSLSIEFRDSSGQPIGENQLLLPNVGDSVLLQVHVEGTIPPGVKVAQVSIEHDETVIRVVAPANATLSRAEPLCDGPFLGAFAGSGPIQGEAASSFGCGISTEINSSDSNHIMNLVVERVSAGEPTLSFKTADNFATQLVEPGTTAETPVITHDFNSYGSLTVVAPTPTPVPTATTPPVGGGGGGGGGVPAPQPTAAPSGPVLVVPGVPRNVTVTPVAGGVTVKWDPPTSNGGSPITGYRVLVIPTGQAVSVPALQTQTTITGLNPNVAYQFQVNAANSVGAGQGTGLSSAVSPLGLLTAPVGVSATVRADNSSAIVTWQAPLLVGSSPVTGYTIISNPAVGNGMEVGAGQLSVVFPGLAFNAAYSFRVHARTADGNGPLSDPSNTVTTGGPTSGSPGDIPGSTPKPAVDASDEELTEFESAVSSAFGSQINLNRGTPAIKTVTGGLVVEFDANPNGASTAASGSIKSKVGKLDLDITNGSGTAKLSIDEQVSITGSARLGTGTNSVQVQIDNPQLMFAPAAPPAFTGGGGLVTQVGADFGVGLSQLPESIGLTARFIQDIAEVPDAVTSFQLAAGASGGEIQDPGADIAFIVVVDKQGISNNELGDNRVTLTVSKAWYDQRQASGKQIFITKVGDDGATHTAAAACEVTGDLVRCTALFSGAAGGFSLFGVVALSPRPVATATVVAPTVVTPTATTVATAVPTVSPTATATALPSPTVQPTAQATATPLPALQPSPQPPPAVDPDLPADEGGGFPLWASLLIAFGGLAVLIPATAAGYSVYRRRGAA